MQGHSSTLTTPNFLPFPPNPCAYNTFALPGLKHTRQERQQDTANTAWVAKPGTGTGI